MPAPTRKDTKTQTELQGKHAVIQAFSSTEYLSLLLVLCGNSENINLWCSQVGVLLSPVVRLQDEMYRLKTITGLRKKEQRKYTLPSQGQILLQKKAQDLRQPVFPLCQAEAKNSKERNGWRDVPAQS